MLSPAHPLTDDAAIRWARAGVPHWVPRWLLTTGWLLALGSTVLTVAGSRTLCSAADPAACGPDLVSTGLVVLLLATPVLLLWLPPLGCLAGVLLAAGELLLDDRAGPRLAFGLHGMACLLVGLWLLAAAGRQREAAKQAAGGLSAVVPAQVGERPELTLRVAAAGVFALVAAGLLGWYWHLVEAEDQHLARAVRLEAPIAGRSDPEARLTVRVPAGGGRQRDLAIDVADARAYPERGTVPVLVDPADRGWVRLVAEPMDETPWAGAGAGAGLLALLLLWRELDHRAGLRRLPGHRPALRVRIVPDDEGEALVLPAAGAPVPVARLAVEAWPGGIRPQPEPEPEPDEAAEQAAAERAWRGDPGPEPGFFGKGPAPVDAVLAGDLRDRGWAVLQTADGLLLPLAPLAVRRWAASPEPSPLSRLPLAGAWRPYDRSTVPDDDLLPGIPVAPAARPDLPGLPLVAGPPADARWQGGLALAAGLLGAPVAIWGTAADDTHMFVIAVSLVKLAEWGGNRALLRVELSAERLVLRNGTRVLEVPWPQLAGVRRDGEYLFPKLRGDHREPRRYGPFAPGPQESPQESQEQAAERLAATMMALRERGAGPGTGPVVSRRRPLWWAFGLYGLAIVAALLWSWLT